MMDDPTGPPRTLYVGNLELAVTEDLLYMLFSQFGYCLECKIIREVGHDPYAFVKFAEHPQAQAALMAMNKRNVMGKELKVNWASHPGTTVKQDTTNHYHIYVGDLSPDIDAIQIKNAFSPFGEISDCKIIRDPHTQMSKGYAFVCFVRKEDAENAITTMNGQWLGGRTIKTNWASGKGNMMNLSRIPGRPLLDYDEVYNQSSPNNVTIYCAGIQSGLTEELLRETFNPFGNIVDIRIFKEKCFAFIRMDRKDSACNGIVGVHGTEVNGYMVKCSWGKDPEAISSPKPNNTPSVSSTTPSSGSSFPPSGGYNPYYNQMGYWAYPQAYMNAAYNQQMYAGYQGYGGQWPANSGTTTGMGSGDGFYSSSNNANGNGPKQ